MINGYFNYYGFMNGLLCWVIVLLNAFFNKKTHKHCLHSYQVLNNEIIPVYSLYIRWQWKWLLVSIPTCDVIWYFIFYKFNIKMYLSPNVLPIANLETIEQNSLILFLFCLLRSGEGFYVRKIKETYSFKNIKKYQHNDHNNFSTRRYLSEQLV